MSTATLNPSTPMNNVTADDGASIVRTRALIGILLLVGTALSFLGFSWDVQWHTDVGPDTFFTLPHLVLYSGVALAGLTCLGAVLYETARYQRTHDPFIREHTVGVLGVFRAPLGFLISGLGAAAFLNFGLFDLWWHTIYGFDVTVSSPPHIGLLTSIQVIMIGVVVLYSSAVSKLARNRQGNPLSIPLFGLGFSVITSIVMTPYMLLSVFPVLFISLPLIGGMFAMVGMLICSVTRRFDILIIGSMVMLVLYSLLNAVFVQWATATYADSLSLFLRETAKGYADVPSALPYGMLPVSIVLALGLRAAQQRQWPVGRTVLIGGSLAGAVLSASYLLQLVVYRYIGAPLPIVWYLAMALGGAIAGGLLGLFGWQLGTVVRRLGH
jgi:hypothetical protein